MNPTELKKIGFVHLGSDLGDLKLSISRGNGIVSTICYDPMYDEFTFHVGQHHITLHPKSISQLKALINFLNIK